MNGEPDGLGDLARRLQASDPASARRMLDEALRKDPADPRLLLLLAADLVHRGDLDQAEAVYTAALQGAPDFAIARFQLGLLQLTSARPAVARATWAPLDLLGEKDPLRLFKHGLELLAQDRFDEARHHLEQGIEENRSNPALNRDMQLVLDRIAARDGTPAGTKDSRGAATAPEPEEHVLVSSYRKR